MNHQEHIPVLSFALAIALLAPIGATDLVLGPAELEHALTIGRASDAERARFHDRYLVTLTDPTAQQLEVKSEFRRVVLAAEDRIRQGDHVFSARQANEATRPWRGKLTIALRLRFHPQNVLARVPSYEVAIGQPGGAAAATLKALDVRRTPLYAVAGPGQKRGAATPLVGGLVESDFDAVEIGQTTRGIRVMLEGKEVARTAIDFARIE